jgi:hypothetical protein
MSVTESVPAMKGSLTEFRKDPVESRSAGMLFKTGGMA